MIEYNPQKYLVRDEMYCSECSRRLSDIDKAFTSGSLISLINIRDSIDKFEIIYKKNLEQYKRSYDANLRELESFKEKISWEFTEPYSEFETNTLRLVSEAETLLAEKSYTANNKSKEKIAELKAVLNEYIEKTGLVDYRLRLQLNNRLSNIKKMLNSGSYFSLLTAEKSFGEIDIISEMNSRQYEKIYSKTLKKNEILRLAFGKSEQYFNLNDKKRILEQFVQIDRIMESQSYDEFENARDILDEIDVKLGDVSIDKKKKISESIERQLESIKTEIWMEDWDSIRRSVDTLIKDADETGRLYNLNLDKFNLDQKRTAKKNDIINFIGSLRNKQFNNRQDIISKAEMMLKKISYKNDLSELSEKASVSSSIKVSSYSKTSDVSFPERKKARIKIAVLVSLIFISVALFSYNQVAETKHSDQQGAKLAELVEAYVFAFKKSGIEFDTAKIRSKIKASPEIFEIVSINDIEVIVKYRGVIYKKKMRE
jgi:hypothetical protein